MMWSFSVGGGWVEIVDFLATSETTDCAEEKRLAGFCSHPNLLVGDDEGIFSVEVFNRTFVGNASKEPQYEFLAAVSVGGYVQYVAIPKLPDLLEFLRQTVPLSTSIDEWSIKRQKYLDRIEREISR
ncbi:hypothetical protein [Ferribacterium limneticum]|uniref:hypothetical protein n=1 Tax=Ferribacterium limneticum TaxID=76259 RepID=UPI001CF8AD6F|nr:hypothetical protein [Ferribacterium limneticum]UCV22853.1 hypothetical protein KI613_20480 [Ferribacterium limneticum]